MDKLQTIENVIKYMPLPAFVAKDGQIILKNEQAKNVALGDVSEKLLSVEKDGGSVMWEDRVSGQRCSMVAWKADEFSIMTVSSLSSDVSEAAKKISRGIRETLSSIHSCSKIIMSKLDESDPQNDEYCAAMAHNLYKSMRLMGNIDTLADFDEYDLERKSKVTDIKKLIQELAEKIKPYTEALGMELECRVPSAIAIAMADDVLLETAIGNLIENSFRYSPKGSKVTVKLDIIQKNLVITVKDNGLGMSPQKLQHIATANYEWQSVSDMFASSAGMGLLIAKFAAYAHGGSMVIESRGGVGTGVTLTIPYKKPDSLIVSVPGANFKPDHLSPLIMFADILPRESYMYVEL